MDKSPVIPIATAPSPPPPMTSHPTTASTFERLENARIESADMQENMSKLSSFFDKYSKDKVSESPFLFIPSTDQLQPISLLIPTYIQTSFDNLYR